MTPRPVPYPSSCLWRTPSTHGASLWVAWRKIKTTMSWEVPECSRRCLVRLIQMIEQSHSSLSNRPANGTSTCVSNRASSVHACNDGEYDVTRFLPTLTGLLVKLVNPPYFAKLLRAYVLHAWLRGALHVSLVWLPSITFACWCHSALASRSRGWRYPALDGCTGYVTGI
jgi:hypothetical protein